MAKVPTVKAETGLVQLHVEKFELKISADPEKWRDAATGIVDAIRQGVVQAVEQIDKARAAT